MITARLLRLVAVCSAITIVAGCGASGRPSQGASTQSQAAPAASPAQTPGPAAPGRKITLRLPWVMSGYMDPFVLAEARGYYRDAGLDVSIQEGKGSVLTAETVANGTDTFGYVDVSAVANLISQGAPIKVIADVDQESPLSFVHRADLTIKSPHDLIGHPIITNASDNGNQILPAVLAKAGMSMTQLKFDLVDPSAYFSSFMRTPGSILLSSINSTYQALLKQDPSIQATPFAQFGVNLLSFGLITSSNEIRDRPAEVRAFAAASLKGWQAAVDNPQAATDAAVKAFPRTDPTVELAQLKQTLKMLHTSASQDHPLGWMADSDWQQTLSILHTYAGVKTVRPTSDYYTNEFLP